MKPQKSQNLPLVSTLITQEVNSKIVDEFLGFCEASDTDKTKVYRGSELKQSLKSRHKLNLR